MVTSVYRLPPSIRVLDTHLQAMEPENQNTPLESLPEQLFPLLILAVAYFLFGRLREYRRLKHFPGPSTTGISWWWHSKAVLSGRCYEHYGDVTEKYGMWRVWSIAGEFATLMSILHRSNCENCTQSSHHFGP